MTEACIFCQIARHESPAEILYEDELVIAFQDLRPIAPVHLLVVPKRHIASVNELTTGDEKLLGYMILVARDLAHRLQVEESGYRLILNTGPDAGQTIFHLHLHVIGGRKLMIRLP